jgi:hypothetical protein
MKIVGILGILLFLFGGLVLLIGLVVCVNTWTSDYATTVCARAEEDKKKFGEAKELCGDVTSDCYRQATATLTSDDDCEHAAEVMNKQMLMGVIPAIVGGLLAVVGFFMGVGGFFLGRKKATAT